MYICLKMISACNFEGGPGVETRTNYLEPDFFYIIGAVIYTCSLNIDFLSDLQPPNVNQVPYCPTSLFHICQVELFFLV